jgi:photosystem II stability/assembly factor-like uncharacterized protein
VGNDTATDQAVVVKTIDGGTTFSTIQSASALGHVSDIACGTSNICTAVVDASEILRTEDGGMTWSDLASPFEVVPEVVSEVECLTASLCYATGKVAGLPVVARSNDAGANWTDMTPQPLIPGTFQEFTQLRCFDQERCAVFYLATTFAFGPIYSRTLFETADGGMTWTGRAAPIGGRYDCAEESWCIRPVSPSSIQSFTPPSDQWSELDVTAPMDLGTLLSGATVRCPLAEYCFFLGKTQLSGSYITRIRNPSWPPLVLLP